MHKVSKWQSFTVKRKTNTKTLHSHTETVHNRKCSFFRKYAIVIVKGESRMPRQSQTELEVINEGASNIFALPPEDYQTFVAQCTERVTNGIIKGSSTPRRTKRKTRPNRGRVFLCRDKRYQFRRVEHDMKRYGHEGVYVGQVGKETIAQLRKAN